MEWIESPSPPTITSDFQPEIVKSYLLLLMNNLCLFQKKKKIEPKATRAAARAAHQLHSPLDCKVPYRSAISPEATDLEIREELYKLMTMETRVFIVHMMPDLGNRVFEKAMEIGMMDAGYVWIMTDGIADMLSNMNSTVLESMEGVLGIRNHIPKSKELEEFTSRWKRQFQSDNPDVLDAKLDIFGIRAHDVALALAMAVEEVFSNITQCKDVIPNNRLGLTGFGISVLLCRIRLSCFG